MTEEQLNNLKKLQQKAARYTRYAKVANLRTYSALRGC